MIRQHSNTLAKARSCATGHGMPVVFLDHLIFPSTQAFGREIGSSDCRTAGTKTGGEINRALLLKNQIKVPFPTAA